MGPDAVRGELSPPDIARAEPTPAASAGQAIGPYLRAVRRHWILVVGVTLLAGIVAAYTAYHQGASYQATASILVSPIPEGDPTFLGLGLVVETGDPARTVETAAALIDSPQAAAATAAALGHGWTPASVKNAVSVTPLGQSNVLAVTATASSPSQAANVANTFATAAVNYRASIVQHNIAAQIAGLEARIAAVPRGAAGSGPQIADLSTRLGELRAARSSGADPTLSVSERAQRPGSPTGAPHWLVVLLALIGGFAIASVAALGLEFFSRPIRDSEELSTLFPAPVLASVPNVRHPSDAPLSPWLFPPGPFEQVRMLRVQLELSSNPSVIMVTSAGAGDGKTTLAAALAAALSESGRSVILMDLDFRKPTLAQVVSVAPRPGEAEAEEQPSGALIPIPNLPHVKLLPLPAVTPSTLDDLMARLPVLLAQAQRVVDYVVVDTAPVGEVSEALRIAPMCESVVFVARPRHTDRRKVIVARDLLERAGVHVAGMVLIGDAAPGSYGGYYGYGAGEPGGMSGEPPGRNGAGLGSGARRRLRI